MSDNTVSNKRIAKNTIALYVRMLFAMIVSLYTSRVVLNYLGEDDYGIQNVVAGIVTMFAFLSTTLASASQRYFAFEIGKNNEEKLSRVFSLTIILYLIVIGIIVVFAEILGVWFVNEKMLIPEDRLYAANWVFQISIISFCVTIFATPYQAIIIARERMDIYAIVGILDALLHLLFVVFLQLFVHDCDALISYGFIMLLYKCICQTIYVYIAKKRFSEARLTLCWDGPLAKEMMSYSFWNIFGAVANVFRSQGINMLISAFFAPAVNAARGIAYQVNNALNVFATNFYTAVRPQVTKRYAAGNLTSTLELVFMSSKFTYFLLAFISIPMFSFVNTIMEMWLVKVPESAQLFTRLVIIVALIDSLSNPIMTLMQATGNVKTYQLVTGGLILLNLPLSWILLHLGYTAEYTMYVAIVIAGLSLLSRVLVAKKYVQFPLLSYMVEVLIPVIIVTVLLFLSSFGFYILSQIYDTLFVELLFFFASIFFSIMIIFVLGLNKTERGAIIKAIKNRIKRKI